MHTEIFTATFVASNPNSRHFLVNEIKEKTILFEENRFCPIRTCLHAFFSPSRLIMLWRWPLKQCCNSALPMR